MCILWPLRCLLGGEMVNREGVLPTAPLYFVLSGVRFKLRESLPAWIGPIQESLHEAGYPHLSRVRQSAGNGGMELAIDPEDFDPAHPGAAFLFSSNDRTSSIQIHKSGLTVFSKSYMRFDQFVSGLSSAVEAILSSSKYLEIETIGIRYLDFIRPRDGEQLSEYVSGGLLPFQPSWEGWDGRVLTGAHMSSYKIGDDRLSVRLLGEGNPVVPPDLAMAFLSSLNLAEGLNSDPIPMIGNEQGTLDIDAFRDGFLLHAGEVKQVEDEVRRLHDVANKFFRKVCSDHAFSRWNEESQ